MKNINYYLNFSEINYKMAFHGMTENFVSDEINENSQEVLNLIRKGDLETTPKEFKKSLEKSEFKEMLTDYSEQELSKMKLFKVPGYNIGFAIKQRKGKWNEIVAVHNNEKNIKGVGKELILFAIKQGGEYLDHFDGFLTDFYKQLGFVEYNRDEFDPQYDPEGKFREKFGEADIIYRKLKK
jgi:hypothetical protein